MSTAKPIKVHDLDGREAWAWETDTDPDMVLWAVIMAYGRGQSLCLWDCPATTGQYCVECHGTAWAAREELRRRGYQ